VCVCEGERARDEQTKRESYSEKMCDCGYVFSLHVGEGEKERDDGVCV